ncbi:helix-turn-helix domain-containing protein [Saccharopolyspora flava]|uniref:Transposase n=1 Tax=Saccharopolyspora flava TaxID=95161 RepID=A0A1I6SRR9_9PSEU|nr:helix-turn-helix domain-containing protein [Saccharopolyspora flava]SFS79596.1 Transposase [Saccharopolyspora flava]
MDIHAHLLHGGARSLPADALEKLRRQAVAASESGLSHTYVARMYGISRKTVGNWVRDYQRRGEAALVPQRRGRRPGERLALDDSQQLAVLRTMSARLPDEAGLPHLLWTRRAVVELIHRDLGTALSPATVDQYFVRWGVRTKHLPPILPGDLPAPVPGVERIAVAWLCPRPLPEAEPLQVLLAVTGRGVLFFMAGERPFEPERLAEFRKRLGVQVSRSIRPFVRAWPDEHHELRPLLDS